MTNRIKSNLKDGILILLGVASAAFGLESLLMPNHFIDGGVTGISLLLAKVTGWRLSIWLLLVNVPFLILAHYVIGRRFAIKTAMAIFLLAVTLFSFHFPEVTDDKLLVAVFGGFFLGAGIGLSMRGGSVLDGTEILAIFLSRRTGLKVSDWIILINLLIFGTAAYVLSIEQSLYSMLTYFVATKSLDFVIDGIEEYTGVTIISPSQSSAIRKSIVDQMGSGVTVFYGSGGHRSGGEVRNVEILYTVITRLEIRKLTLLIDDIDPDAFVTMGSINDISGGMVKRRKVVE